MLWLSSAPARHPEGFIEPCLPTLGSAVPSGPKWAYEIKHDGFRFICRREGDRVRVFSRGGYDWTDRVPLIAKALAALRVKSVTLDGEGVKRQPRRSRSSSSPPKTRSGLVLSPVSGGRAAT
jgi:ATP-dependent DNA ligase